MSSKKNQYGVVVIYDEKCFYLHNIRYDIENIEHYYITKNHSKVETSNYFKISLSTLTRIFKHYNIKKSRMLSHELNKKTCLEKYGNENYNNMEKQKVTMLKKYGVDNYFKNTKEMQKIYFNKFGVTNPNKTEIVREKIRQTCIERYGVDSYTKTSEFKQKSMDTLMKHYGVTTPMKSNRIKAKYDFKLIAEKAFQTKMRNNTTNTSKYEKELLTILVSKFGIENVNYQYKNRLYPFHCDFYIHPLDMYVELNLHFTHGGHPFNENDTKDIEILSIRKDKARKSKFYENAIRVRTKVDKCKQQCAFNNNLNYIMIYNENEYNKFKQYILKRRIIK